MRRQKGSGEIIFSLVALASILAVLAIVEAVGCHARWKHSGLESSWGPLQGCLVTFPDGRQIPDDRVREIEIPKAGLK